MHAVISVVEDLLGLLSKRERALLCALLETSAGADRAKPVAPADAGIAEILAGKLGRVLSYDPDGPLLRFHSRSVEAFFREALKGGGQAGRAGEVLDAQLAAIRAAQAQEDWEQAARLFRGAGGIYFIHLYGLAATLNVLRAFPLEILEQDEVLLMARAMHALKTGNVSRARHFLVERYGPDVLSLETVVSKPEIFSPQFRVFRTVMAIYEDVPISQALREKLFAILAELEIDDHLHRGGFYNAILAVSIDKQELAVAEELADRAYHHFKAAEAHLLVFYIEFHRALIALRRGRLGEAERALGGARDALSKVTFESAADWRLLGLMEAIVALERGEAQPLVTFISEEFDKFAYGEVWPTIVEPALLYCSQVLNNQIGLGAALSFLDRWRVQEWRSRRFNLVLTMREVDILQTAKRWQHAADKLMAVQSRINLTWLESAGEALTRLVDPAEIDLAMAWLRHLVEHVPRRPFLREQIAALLRNDALGERQRARAELWMAHLARLNRDISAARRHFSNVLESIARLGVIVHVLGEAAIIATLLEDKRIASHALATAERRSVVRRLKGLMQKSDTDHPLLTRQELRVLRLVTEGGTNKFVARQLRLSEVTVKFHLSNVYRKIGCGNRSEAIAAARSLGWVE